MNIFYLLSILIIICYTIAVLWRTYDWFISAPLRHVSLSDYVFWHGRMEVVTPWALVMEVVALGWGVFMTIFVP